MSNKSNEEQPPSAKESLLEIDILVVMNEGYPVAVLPETDRARSLFIYWGMLDQHEGRKLDGIRPPLSAMDLFNSIPKHWLTGVRPAEEIEEFYLQEVTLPQALPVVQ